MAMPWGRSVVTLQGPSLARRSASARRWRMDSSVQASLRTMAECRASASASETRVMGMPAAWAHDTSVTTRTAVFTITDCSGYDMGRWENPGTDRTDTDCSGYRLGRWGQTGDEKPPRGVGSEPGDRQDWQRISGKRRRKFMSVLSVPCGALVGGVELAADQGDQGDQVHPDEKRDAAADGAIHHVVAGQIAHVPGESQGGEEPQNGGQRGAAPDGLPALFAVGAVVVERCSHGDGGEEGEDVAGDTAGRLPDPGEWGEEGIDLHPVEDGALHLSAEDDEEGGADQGHGGEQDQRHGNAALAEEIAVAGHAVNGLESLDEALDDAGGGPQGNDSGGNQEAGRALAHDAELLDDHVFGAWGDDLAEEVFEGGGDEPGAGLHQDRGGAGEHGEKAEQGGVGGGLGVAEATVVQGGEEALAQQPCKGPESHPHYGQYKRAKRVRYAQLAGEAGIDGTAPGAFRGWDHETESSAARPPI